MHVQNCKSVKYSRDVIDSLPKVLFSGMSGIKASQSLGFTNPLLGWVLQLAWALSCLWMKTTKNAVSLLIAFTELQSPWPIVVNNSKEISVFTGLVRWGILHKLLCACAFLECDAVVFLLLAVSFVSFNCLINGKIALLCSKILFWEASITF